MNEDDKAALLAVAKILLRDPDAEFECALVDPAYTPNNSDVALNLFRLAEFKLDDYELGPMTKEQTAFWKSDDLHSMVEFYKMQMKETASYPYPIHMINISVPEASHSKIEKEHFPAR